MILFYDTETTGLPLFSEPSEHPGQPHIVQIAALLTDDDGKKISSVDLIIEPYGWAMDDRALAVHGITVEHATAVGVPADAAFEVFLTLWRHAEKRIGFNEPFDARMVRIELCRLLGKNHATSGDWKAGNAECVKVLATPFCKEIPPTDKMMAAGRKHPKTPKLTEAYAVIMGKPMTNAHNAMGDVIATRALYFKIKEQSA